MISKAIAALRDWATTTMRFARSARNATPGELIAGAQKGSVPHFGELYRRYYQVVVDHLKPMAGSDAEDIAQVTFIRLQTKLEQYQERGAFEAWLKGVAYNVYRTYRRSADRRRESVLDETWDSPVGLDRTGPVTRDDFWSQALRKMPRSLSDVWLMHRDGYEAREIAAKLGISANAAATRLSRARDYLDREVQRLTGR